MANAEEIVKSRKFQTRLFSGIILVILAILVITAGGLVLFGTLLIVSLVGLFELYRVEKIEKEIPGIIGYAAGIAYYALLWNSEKGYDMPVLIGALMALLAVYVLTYPRYRTEQVAVGLMGIVYTVVMFSYIYRVRNMQDGKWLVWLIFLSSWGCDTFAYVVGMLIGKTHFAPVLSPKKTVAGSVGGVIGAAVLGVIYGIAVQSHLTAMENPAAAFGFACAAGALISQIGDLAASAIKRDHAVKDYGTLIPGHGGILDRFDSMIFTAPAVFFALYLYALAGGRM